MHAEFRISKKNTKKVEKAVFWNKSKGCFFDQKAYFFQKSKLETRFLVMFKLNLAILN
jgi:hypothetical protein